MMTLASVALGGPPVLAYIDPGSGSMLLQVAIAGLLSGLFFVRSSWSYLKCRVLGGPPDR